MKRLGIWLLVLVVPLGLPAGPTEGRAVGPAYGLTSRLPIGAYLNGSMPPLETGSIPSLLSGTGAFTDVPNLTPDPALVPLEPINPLWSDGAVKSRWIALPTGTTVTWSPTGEWSFPAGTVFVKHFELPTDENDSMVRTRLETRLLVVKADGTVYGVTYKWRSDDSEADLLPSFLDENHTITQVGGGMYTKTYHYPSRMECLGCHTPAANFILSASTKQLNWDILYPSTGVTDNQVHTWNYIGMFDTALVEADIPTYDVLSKIDDTGAPIEQRIKSYLHSNCSHCHRPTGPCLSVVAGNWDGRYETPMAGQNIINGAVNNTLGITGAMEVVPKDIWRSIMLVRTNTTDPVIRMPLLDRNHVDPVGVAAIIEWIDGLSGTAALAPPAISPDGGSYVSSVTVSMQHPDPQAEIRYTTDGSDPTLASTLYTGPFAIATDLTVTARAFRTGTPTSAASAASFTFGLPPASTVATPTLTPNGGAFTNSVTVALATATGGATLRYTTDGTTPTANSREVTGPIPLTTTAMLKVRGFAAAMNDSPVAAAIFVLSASSGGGGGGGGGGCGMGGLETLLVIGGLFVFRRWKRRSRRII